VHNTGNEYYRRLVLNFVFFLPYKNHNINGIQKLRVLLLQ